MAQNQAAAARERNNTTTNQQSNNKQAEQPVDKSKATTVTQTVEQP